jgi:WD40 repeat protein
MIFAIALSMGASSTYTLLAKGRQLKLVGVTGTGKFIISTDRNSTYLGFTSLAVGTFDNDVIFHNGAAAVTSPLPSVDISADSDLFVANGSSAGQICVYFDDLS